jgi:hypothetical protein
VPAFVAASRGGDIEGRSAMKRISEYLERALQFENLADGERDLKLKEHLLKQAADYRRNAAERAQRLGLPLQSKG